MSASEDLLIETIGAESLDHARSIAVYPPQEGSTAFPDIRPADSGGAGFLLDGKGRVGDKAVLWQFSSQV